MEVEVDVNETDIVKVNVGDSTIVEVDAYLKREFKGVVTKKLQIRPKTPYPLTK